MQEGEMRSSKDKTIESEILPGGLPKCPTGIYGLDEITLDGLPRGRPALVCGTAGCGKTLLGADELAGNVASLGFDLVGRKKLVIDHIYIDRSLIEEAGQYDLEFLGHTLSAGRLESAAGPYRPNARDRSQ
jgi:circadian clock protein KaiC